jgi:hypothetical protein
MSAVTLLSSAIATGAGEVHQPVRSQRTFQGYGSVSASTGSATIKIQASNDGSNWLDLGTISLSLTTTASSDGFASDAPWKHVRANVTAISGTDATVTVTMGG